MKYPKGCDIWLVAGLLFSQIPVRSGVPQDFIYLHSLYLAVEVVAIYVYTCIHMYIYIYIYIFYIYIYKWEPPSTYYAGAWTLRVAWSVANS